MDDGDNFRQRPILEECDHFSVLVFWVIASFTYFCSPIFCVKFCTTPFLSIEVSPTLTFNSYDVNSIVKVTFGPFLFTTVVLAKLHKHHWKFASTCKIINKNSHLRSYIANTKASLALDCQIMVWACHGCSRNACIKWSLQCEY